MSLLKSLRQIAFLTSLTCVFSLQATALSPKQEITQKSPQALRIIKEWRTEPFTKNQAQRKLHIIYWTPSDREPAPQYRERLTRVMTHIQSFYGKEMNRLGFGPQTIHLDIAADQLLNIHLVKAPNPYADYKPSDGNRIRKESLPILAKAGVDTENETIVIFCNMSNWDSDKRIITQNSPYYASGTNRRGCAWQVDSPILDPVNLDKKQPTLRDGQYGNISLGRYNSIFVGGVCHELGHALGLPHNCQRQDEQAAYGTALMGSGNRTYGEELRGEGKGSFLTLAHGLRLTTHPMFSGTSQAITERGKSTLSDIDIEATAKTLTITGKVMHAPGTPPVYAILAYFDPEGNGNYDATTATAIPDTEGNFTLTSSDLKPKKSTSLRLIALYSNGDATSHIGTSSPYTYPYTVDQNGQPHLDTYHLLKHFQPVRQASQSGDQKKVQSTLKKLTQSPNTQTAAIAKRLLTREPIFPSPAKIDTSITNVTLADTTPSSAKVGYFKPMYNRLPNSAMLMLSSSQVFTTGIYAHAPAKHVYQLEGKWKKFTGTCGIAQDARGSTIFVIKADGKELWRSKLIKSDKLTKFNVNITGKQNLELIVEDGGDGTGSDWGLWLEPKLTR